MRSAFPQLSSLGPWLLASRRLSLSAFSRASFDSHVGSSSDEVVERCKEQVSVERDVWEASVFGSGVPPDFSLEPLFPLWKVTPANRTFLRSPFAIRWLPQSFLTALRILIVLLLTTTWGRRIPSTCRVFWEGGDNELPFHPTYCHQAHSLLAPLPRRLSSLWPLFQPLLDDLPKPSFADIVPLVKNHPWLPSLSGGRLGAG